MKARKQAALRRKSWAVGGRRGPMVETWLHNSGTSSTLCCIDIETTIQRHFSLCHSIGNRHFGFEGEKKRKIAPLLSLLANLAVHSLLVAHRCTTRSRSQHKSKWMAKSNTFPQYMKRKEWGQEQWRRPFSRRTIILPPAQSWKRKSRG